MNELRIQPVGIVALPFLWLAAALSHMPFLALLSLPLMGIGWALALVQWWRWIGEQPTGRRIGFFLLAAAAMFFVGVGTVFLGNSCESAILAAERGVAWGDWPSALVAGGVFLFGAYLALGTLRLALKRPFSQLRWPAMYLLVMALGACVLAFVLGGILEMPLTA